MPKRRNIVSISAPGSLGLNTEDAPLDLPLEFASKADNCVIDNFGRLAARKGLAVTTTSATPLGSSAGLESIISHTTDSGDVGVFSAGNLKLFSGTETLTDVTGAISVTANNWKFETWDNELWAAQSGHSFCRYDNGGTNVFVAVSGAPAANDVFGGAGRLWATGVASAPTTIYWSALSDGTDWSGGDSGSIDLKEVFNGYDQVVSAVIFNNFLVIFGFKNILVYQGVADPATMTLKDNIYGTGLVSRDAKADIGTDLIFMSKGGLRSLGRLIQADGSQPLADVAKQIRTDLESQVQSETGSIKFVYNEVERFLLVIFPSANLVYCFNTIKFTPQGDLVVTRWTGVDLLCGATKYCDCNMYLGGSLGVLSYSDTYLDNGSSYTMEYLSNPSDLGAPAVNKMIKKIKPVVISRASSNITVKWGYGFSNLFTSAQADIQGAQPAYYGVSLFNNGEYYTSSTEINDSIVYANGSGDVVTMGITGTVSGSLISLQEIEMQLTTGRTL